ncbi:MAG: site-specific integrase [Gammaproteobacteria bacterium]
MATLIKRRRADGVLVYRVQDRTTGYPTLSETFSALKDARQFLRRVEVDRQAGLAGIKRGRQTLSDAIKDFTETAEFRQRKSGKDTQRHLDWWIDRLGALPLSKITPDLIADHLHKLEADGLTGSTVNRYRSALSRVFRYTVKTRRWTDHNPCGMVERRTEGRRRERVIKPAEWTALLKAARALAADNPPGATRAQLANFLRVTYGTGARSGEVHRLRWEYVDLEAGRLVFHETKTGDARAVPLIGDALAAVADQSAARRDGCPWVFPSPLTDHAPASFDESFPEARLAAKLNTPDARGEVLVIHSLRHSAATEAGRNGATAFEIAALTGHKTLAMVQRYTKTDETHALAALNKRAQS